MFCIGFGGGCGLRFSRDLLLRAGSMPRAFGPLAGVMGWKLVVVVMLEGDRLQIFAVE